jgi:hypothetical protein
LKTVDSAVTATSGQDVKGKRKRTEIAPEDVLDDVSICPLGFLFGPH